MSAFTTIARAVRGGLNRKPARAYIIPLDGFNGDIPVTADRRTLQYFPATVSDSQATNYQTKVIPGLSHPLYQWTSGGARTISFEAIFSRDRTYTKEERQAIENGIAARQQSLMGGIGGLVGQASLGIAKNSDPRNVDIPSALAWLRSFLLPEYSVDGRGAKGSTPQRPRPPRKLILGFPGMRINWGVPSLPPCEVRCIMTACEISHESFFHDGSPRLAKVGLSFAEIIQVGGRITPHDAGDKRAVALGGYMLNEENPKDPT